MIGVGHREAREPLVVGGDDVPRCVVVRRVLDHFLVRLHSSRSRCSRSRTSAEENFQFFSGSSSRLRNRRFCSCLETLRKNLRHGGAIPRQHTLVAADVVESLLPDVRRHQLGRQALSLRGSQGARGR